MGVAEMFGIDAVSKFLIIDDHPLFREALHNAVELAYPDADTVDAASFTEAIEILSRDSGFDLALLDLNIPGVRGFDGLLHLRANFPRLPVVVISAHEDPRIVNDVMALGAAGFIPKSSKKAALADALMRVMSGVVVWPDGHDAGESNDEAKEREAIIRKLSSLTPQQLRVLSMLRDGLLNKQIAHELQVGETTVKAHVSEVLRKLEVYSRTMAVIAVSKLGSEDILALDNGFRLASPKARRDH